MVTEIIEKELAFKAIKSSGPGGQHVNKTASRIELSFWIPNSKGLTDREKEILLQRLQSKLSKDGTLIMQCDESRSQHQNKKRVIERFFKLIHEHLKESKPRKESKPTRSSIEKRLKTKRDQSEKKARRKPPKID